MINPLFLPELREMLAEKNSAAMREFCTSLHPARTADFMEGLSEEEIWSVLQHADIARRVEIFHYFDRSNQTEIVERMDRAEAAELIAEIDPYRYDLRIVSMRVLLNDNHTCAPTTTRLVRHLASY